jgi:hypothetical protein
MEHSTAERRLVKSPPELWAEVSSEDALGRRLSSFGEIRITRVQPETTVAWEGERASGTVQLEPAGWGTKVILTATPQRAAQPEPAPEPPPPPPSPQAEIPIPPATDEGPRAGFLARLFRRRQPLLLEAASPDPGPPAPGPEPTPPEPDPAPTLDATQTDAILAGILDDLGAHHRRPARLS